MNRTLGIIGSVMNIICVAIFALCMGINYLNGCYLSSMGIALSLVLMLSAFVAFAQPKRCAAANMGMLVGAMYAAVILVVYFTQLTTVRLDRLSAEAAQILDYRTFGLFFSLDLLGYALMGLSTFFAGLAIDAGTRADRWLKGLLLGHGIFFPVCIVIPMLGVFGANTAAGATGSVNIGTILLLFWCAYFIPIGILSARFFARQKADQ